MLNSRATEIKFMNLDMGNTSSLVRLYLPHIPGYKIVREIGKGANGIVFKGIERKSGRTVAIKVLTPESQKDKDSLHRFQRELHVLSKMNHPYIIRIFKVGKEGTPSIVMEYIKYSLKNILYDKRVKFEKKHALNIIRKLAKALEYAYAKGIVHRDIKPANILFKEDGNPVLSDFGLVRTIHSPIDYTQPFSILGTPHYMSPELCRAEKPDYLSDIYSLGVVLFEMLTGKLPYNSDNLHDLFNQHLDTSVPVLPSDAQKYQPLIDGMMAKEKDKRFNATQVRQMIEEFLSGTENKKQKFLFIFKKNIYGYLLFGAIFIVIIMVILVIFLNK